MATRAAARTPAAARRHYRGQQALTAATIVEAGAAWRLMTPSFDAAWGRVVHRLLRALTTAQRRAAESAPGYVADVLDELGIDAPPDGELQPQALAGVASDGRALDDLLYSSVTRAKQAVADGAGADQALEQGRRWLEQVTRTQVADAQRVAVQTVITSRADVGGYVRMLNPPSCARCVVQAGRWFRYNAGFERHPGCDCRHIPAHEDTADELRTEPRAYFDSLTRVEQDATFGKAGAEAIRLGADSSQVVNARRGMGTTVLHGRRALVTTEGITRRGVYGSSEFAAVGGYQQVRVGRRGYVRNQVERRAKRVRLMPETILDAATDRADAIRLLKLYGYLT